MKDQWTLVMVAATGIQMWIDGTDSLIVGSHITDPAPECRQELHPKKILNSIHRFLNPQVNSR